MKHTVRKWFWVWNFDKEELWLNDMAAQGLCLVEAGFVKYVFEDCAPGEWQIRLELLEHGPGTPEGRKYLNFLEDTGARQVGRWMRWVYFRKPTAEGPFDLFSDNRSRMDHLTRIIKMINAVSLANVVIGIANLGSLGSLGWINLALGILGLTGGRRLKKKQAKLEQEARIFE